jgi:hypothetical protein
MVRFQRLGSQGLAAMGFQVTPMKKMQYTAGTSAFRIMENQ